MLVSLIQDSDPVFHNIFQPRSLHVLYWHVLSFRTAVQSLRYFHRSLFVSHNCHCGAHNDLTGILSHSLVMLWKHGDVVWFAIQGKVVEEYISPTFVVHSFVLFVVPVPQYKIRLVWKSLAFKFFYTQIISRDAARYLCLLLASFFQVLFGTDSHTCNAGAFGQFATGIGNTDASFVMGTGKLLIKSPASMQFSLEGEMPDHLLAKVIFFL